MTLSGLKKIISESNNESAVLIPLLVDDPLWVWASMERADMIAARS